MQYLLFLAGALLGMTIFAAILSGFFRPANKDKYLRLQTNIIAKMAEKQGVDRDWIKQITEEILK